MKVNILSALSDDALKVLSINLIVFVPLCESLIIFLILFGIFNLFSSLLFFAGGYIAVKNTFDYRKIRKNIVDVKDNANNVLKEEFFVKKCSIFATFFCVFIYCSIPKIKKQGLPAENSEESTLT